MFGLFFFLHHDQSIFIFNLYRSGLNGYQLFCKEESRKDGKSLNVFIVSLIIWSSHECFFIDGLKALTFNLRNVEIAKRWQEIEKR